MGAWSDRGSGVSTEEQGVGEDLGRSGGTVECLEGEVSNKDMAVGWVL